MTALDHDAFAAIARARRNPIARLPDPTDYAEALPLPVRVALERAGHCRDGVAARDNRDAQLLRPWGLCDYPSRDNHGRLLTNFGVAVRAHVMDRMQP